MDSDLRHYTKNFNKIPKSHKKPSKSKFESQRKKKFLTRYHCNNELQELIDFAEEFMVQKKKRSYFYFSSQQRKCPKFDKLYKRLNTLFTLINDNPKFHLGYVIKKLKYDYMKKESEFVFEKNKISASKEGKTIKKVMNYPKEKQNLNTKTFISDILYFANSDW